MKAKPFKFELGSGAKVKHDATGSNDDGKKTDVKAGIVGTITARAQYAHPEQPNSYYLDYLSPEGNSIGAYLGEDDLEAHGGQVLPHDGDVS